MHEKKKLEGERTTHVALNVHLFVCEFLGCLGPLIYVGFKHWHWHWHLLAQPWTVIVLYCSEPSLQDVAHCVVGVWGLGKSWCWGLGAGLPLLGLGLCLGQGLGLGLALGLDLGLGLGLGGWGGKHVWKLHKIACVKFVRSSFAQCVEFVWSSFAQCGDFVWSSFAQCVWILRSRFYMHFPCV